MRRANAKYGWALVLVLSLLVGLWLAGCALCTKRLYVYRDTPEKSPPASLALLVTDPNLAQTVGSVPRGYSASACPWAPEQASYETDSYRLSIEALDGKTVYQGLCLDVTPTFACEVHPGARQVRVRIDTFGPGGNDKLRGEQTITLEAGGVYFLWPDCDALKAGQFSLKMERLPEPYTAAAYTRLKDWESVHTRGRSLD